MSTGWARWRAVGAVSSGGRRGKFERAEKSERREKKRRSGMGASVAMAIWCFGLGWRRGKKKDSHGEGRVFAEKGAYPAGWKLWGKKWGGELERLRRKVRKDLRFGADLQEKEMRGPAGVKEVDKMGV